MHSDLAYVQGCGLRKYDRKTSFEKSYPTHYSAWQKAIWRTSYRLFAIDRSIDRSLDRSIARSLDRSVARSIARLVARSLGRSLDRSITRSLGRSVARSLGRSFAWLPSSTTILAGESIKQFEFRIIAMLGNDWGGFELRPALTLDSYLAAVRCSIKFDEELWWSRFIVFGSTRKLVKSSRFGKWRQGHDQIR